MRSLLVAVLALVLPAHAQEPQPARAFFDEFVQRANAFDAEIAVLYETDARVITLRDGAERQEMTGAQWRDLLVRFMPLAKQQGDTSTFESVRVEPRGEGFRVLATRFAALKCVRDPNYHLDVVQAEGGWRIVEEYWETVSLSKCEPSAELTAALQAARKELLPKLPLELDKATRLEAVDVTGSALIYRQRLHTLDLAQVPAKELRARLPVLVLRSACGRPEVRSLIDAGATVRYAYIDSKDAAVVNVDISGAMCSLPAARQG